MPDFWQFPTGSMGLGVINAIYQARFMRYLEHRGLMGASDRRVWGVYGDGELDEPESTAALTLAAREKLDNLTFVVNCNLQRLDGPVRGNGQIIQELESLFTGAGWNVIKVLWGSDWDALFARDKRHVLLRRFAETVDGEYQNLGAHDGDYNRAKFFQKDPDSSALVETMTDAEINALKRGGHDFRKLYAAFSAARAHKGRPTVILAKTKKGFGMGAAGESRMTAHQSKKLDIEALLAFRDRFGLPLKDEDVAALAFYRPPPDSPEMRYLHARRAALGGFLPARRRRTSETPALPPLAVLRGLCDRRGREGDVDHDGGRAYPRRPPEGPGDRPAHRSDRRGRGAHFWHGEPLPADRHLRAAGPALRARGRGLAALLPRGEGRATLGGGHHRGGRGFVMDGGGDRLQRPRPRDAAVLYLLFDVRLSAGRRPDLGRGRPAGARVLAGRHGGSHDARGGGVAASGRRQSRDGALDAELPRLRSGLRLRTRGHHRPRHAPHDREPKSTSSTTSPS